MHWTKETRDERRIRLQTWHVWFAWKPVRLWHIISKGEERKVAESNKIVWLEKVMRKRNPNSIAYIYMVKDDALLMEIADYKTVSPHIDSILDDQDLDI